MSSTSKPRISNYKANASASAWRNPIHWLAFGFGVGTIPVAPGTFGTLVAVPIYLLLQSWPLWFYLGITGLMFVVGIWLCGRTARDVGVRDYPGIVWDEIVGFLIAMTAAPSGWMWLLFGFALFRLLDIFKPWPIRQLEHRVSGGLGIMIDDLLAGVYTAALLQLFVYLSAG